MQADQLDRDDVRGEKAGDEPGHHDDEPRRMAGRGRLACGRRGHEGRFPAG